MQELEKILEEIEKLKEMYKESAFSLIDKGNLPCEYDKSDIESAKVQAISEAITIIRKHMNDGWIPVEERLPEEPKENPEFEGKKIELYLVTVKGTKYPFRAMWNGKFFTDGWSKCNVIAWRPLPEPYRPERSDNHDGE